MCAKNSSDAVTGPGGVSVAAAAIASVAITKTLIRVIWQQHEEKRNMTKKATKHREDEE